MNSLVMLIKDLNLDETKVLNALQGEAGLISDLCVTAEGVHVDDRLRAVNWIIEKQKARRGV